MIIITMAGEVLKKIRKIKPVEKAGEVRSRTKKMQITTQIGEIIMKLIILMLIIILT
jgi:hypothetical protein